jgi:hypothetical protein
VISELAFLEHLTALAAEEGVNTLTSNGPLKDPDTYKHFVEDVSCRDEAVNAIGKCRHAIARLTMQELGVTPEELGRIKVYLLEKMGEYSPYYTQLTNLPVLGKDEKGHTSEQWTCNLTALAMCLNELQITTKDFAGDDKLLSGIMQACIDELKAKGYPIAPDDKILRLPTFLEFAALDVEIDKHNYAREGPSFLRSLSAARKDAAGEVTSNEFLLGLAGLFGVEGKCYEAVYSWGEWKRDKYEEDIKNPEKRIAPIDDKQRSSHLSFLVQDACATVLEAEPERTVSRLAQEEQTADAQFALQRRPYEEKVSSAKAGIAARLAFLVGDKS